MHQMTWRVFAVLFLVAATACKPSGSVTTVHPDASISSGGKGGPSGAGGSGAGPGATGGSSTGSSGGAPAGSGGAGTSIGGSTGASGGSGGAVTGASGGAGGIAAATGGTSASGGSVGVGGKGGVGVGGGSAAGMTGTAGKGVGGGQTAPVDQTTQGSRAALPVVESFDGLPGPRGNPSDNSIAVGPNHIVQVINWSMVVFSKKGATYSTSGMTVKAAASTSAVFAGFGGRCQSPKTGDDIDRGDAIIRYDQLAQRWVLVFPVFAAPYAMCYAVSDTADPTGTYHRYEFARPLFPDYPRLGIWPDGYYVGTSTGDEVVQKHICVADRAKMLAGQPATEQCVTKDNVNFLNPADIDGQMLPPAGAPNIVLALGGTQLNSVFQDDGVYAYKMHVDWANKANTTFTGPVKVPVARYGYLCNGQLSNCVTQPNTTQKLDSQGDKLMQRLSYRNFGDHESLVITHSITGPTGGGGLRWYEFRLNANRDPVLYQQSTYAPDAMYRWLGSAAMDKLGNIGIGYSFGGAPNFPGQRFVARLAADPLGTMGFKETVMIQGQASQTDNLRWEDFSTIVIDPSDDATFWYVGDYFKSGSTTRSTRIGSFRVQ
jgi:hypothetical protein